MAESSYDNASLRRSLGIHTAEQQEALPVMEAFACSPFPAGGPFSAFHGMAAGCLSDIDAIYSFSTGFPQCSGNGVENVSETV